MAVNHIIANVGPITLGYPMDLFLTTSPIA